MVEGNQGDVKGEDNLAFGRVSKGTLEMNADSMVYVGRLIVDVGSHMVGEGKEVVEVAGIEKFAPLTVHSE